VTKPKKSKEKKRKEKRREEKRREEKRREEKIELNFYGNYLVEFRSLKEKNCGEKL